MPAERWTFLRNPWVEAVIGFFANQAALIPFLGLPVLLVTSLAAAMQASRGMTLALIAGAATVGALASAVCGVVLARKTRASLYFALGCLAAPVLLVLRLIPVLQGIDSLAATLIMSVVVSLFALPVGFLIERFAGARRSPAASVPIEQAPQPDAPQPARDNGREAGRAG